MKEKKILRSGSVLELDYASWKDVKNLKNIILNIIKNNIKDFDLQKEISNILEIVNKNGNDWFLIVLDKFLTSLLDCYSSQELENIFYELSKKCLLSEEKITDTTFEDINNRCDYIECFFYIIKFNLEPFFLKANMK